MNKPDQAWWARARSARDQLAAQLLNHPGVSLIDIGLDPQGLSQAPVLRVHVRQASVALPNLPGEIGGIPIRLVYGDYTLESER
jgi:hypothetical protein